MLDSKNWSPMRREIFRKFPCKKPPQHWRGDTLLIDVRDPDERQEGHIPGAKNFSRGTVELEIEEAAPNLSTPIITHCGGGGRSALTAESLQRMGYTNVKSMAGGFKAWKAAGLPTTK